MTNAGKISRSSFASRFIKIIILLTAFCTSVCAQEVTSIGFESDLSSAQAKPWLFYEIRQSGKLRGYLFGVSHVPIGKILIPKKIQSSLANSTALVLESNYFDVNIQLQGSMALKSNPGGKSLQEILSPSVFARLNALYDSKQIPESKRAVANLWSPYLVATVMDSECTKFQAGGLSPESVIFRYAEVNGIRVFGMESVEDQLGWLSKLSTSQWDNYLSAYLDWLNNIDCRNISKRSIQKAWDGIVNGDVDSIYEEYVRFYTHDLKILWLQEEYLVTARNVTLKDKLVQVLNAESTPFFSIGALHLGGPKGILNLLRSNGYEVVQR